MEPGHVPLLGSDQLAMVNHAVSDSRQDVGVDALVEWPGVTNFLLKGPRRSDPVALKDLSEGLFRDCLSLIASSAHGVPGEFIYN
jgi:hypothetical protein